jgi:L-ascorbate metabolism protein UlaG (beta-lactamase superfamily)
LSAHHRVARDARSYSASGGKRAAVLTFLLLLVAAWSVTASAHETARAHYLANEGVMVAHGETKVLFDPLFNESFGEYRLVPDEMRRALFAGEPPWDGVDAVFISHYHDDHFSPADLVELLRVRGDVHLYAPAQAVTALRAVDGAEEESIARRIHAVALAYRDEPQRIAMPGLVIEAVRIPHAGWPDTAADVENIAWRVTLDESATVLHLGDADTNDAHFAAHEDYWRQRRPHIAFPPYWYFLSREGLTVLGERLRPLHAVGIHVPVTVPEDPAERDESLREVDLFTRPGETRDVPHGD